MSITIPKLKRLEIGGLTPVVHARPLLVRARTQIFDLPEPSPHRHTEAPKLVLSDGSKGRLVKLHQGAAAKQKKTEALAELGWRFPAQRQQHIRAEAERVERIQREIAAMMPPQTPRKKRVWHAETEKILSPTEHKEVEGTPSHAQHSVLDFEHLFAEYFVEVQPLRCWRKRLEPPSPDEVMQAWMADTVRYIMKHHQICEAYWPDATLSSSSLEKHICEEIEWTVEGPSKRGAYRIIITLLSECTCHRLLWAIGDAVLPERFLDYVQNSLTRRWPSSVCHLRCKVSFWQPWCIFHTFLVLTTIAFYLCLKSAHSLGDSLFVHGVREASTRGKLMDHFAARLLCLGGLGHLWLFYFVAASFPLRSLHSPFERDLGSLIAYSASASRISRVLGPLTSLAKPAALFIRFSRLGLGFPHLLSIQFLVIASAALMPVAAMLVTFTVRSSFYSYHHFCYILNYLVNGVVTLGFTLFLEVAWPVLGVAALLAGFFILFTQYTSEFTSANLVKAAQIQWASIHILVVLSFVLALALEVEAGFAKAFVNLFCSVQQLIPANVCRRLLSGQV